MLFQGRCITCGTIRVCAAGPDEPLPDPFAERPDDLPPPGGACSLVSGSSDEDFLCATCTREDGGATRTCRHAAIEPCVPESGADAEGCFDCSRDDGDIVRVCYPPLR